VRKFFIALALTVTLAAAVTARQHFAVITGVDVDKGTVVYTITFGKERDTEVKAKLAKGCVIREGFYRLGKPARTKEGDEIVNGLRDPRFQKATAEKPLRVNVYTADADDADRGVKRGEVVKILVNPTFKKKP
jgi:hypothetical protein